MSRERKTRCICMPRTIPSPTNVFNFQCVRRKNLQCLTLTLSRIQVHLKNNDSSFFRLNDSILISQNEHNIITQNHPQTCVFPNHSGVTLTKHYLCCLSVNHSGDQELGQMQKKIKKCDKLTACWGSIGPKCPQNCLSCKP